MYLVQFILHSHNQKTLKIHVFSVDLTQNTTTNRYFK